MNRLGRWALRAFLISATLLTYAVCGYLRTDPSHL